MHTDPQSPTSDVMTPDRLRSYWFGGPQVPFWNHDARQLQVGVEIEYFIAHRQGSGLSLAKQADFRRVAEGLTRNYGYRNRNLPDQPARVSKDTPLGFVAIKPDFAWHILEIAFPPRHDTLAVAALIKATLDEVDRVLFEQGLVRLPISCLPDVPEEMELVDLKRLREHVDVLARQATSHPWSQSLFPALIAATHLHFNVFEEKSLITLPMLYAQEADAILRFGRPEAFKNKTSNDHRSAFYRESLGHDYLLCNIPAIKPSSIEEYCLLYNRTPKLFPGDPFFPARDLTYIRPSRFGTLEFRSSPAHELEVICEIIEFRRAQLVSNLEPSSSLARDPRRDSHEAP